MENKKLNGAIFDAILTQGLRDVLEEEFAALDEALKALPEPPKPKARYLRAERRALRRVEPTKWQVPRVLKQVAMVVAIIGLVGFLTVMSMPTVRAAVINAVVDVYEDFAKIRFGQPDNSVVVGDYVMGYVPQGYALVEKEEGEMISRYTFENSDKQSILFEYQPNTQYHLQLDADNAEIHIMHINNLEVIISVLGENVSAFWEDGQANFRIVCTLTENDLQLIIQNLKTAP